MSQNQFAVSELSAAEADQQAVEEAQAQIVDQNKQKAEMIALLLADCLSMVQKFPEFYAEVAEALALYTGGKIQMADALAMMAPSSQEEPTAGGEPEAQEEETSARVLVASGDSRKRKADGTANEGVIKRPKKVTGSLVEEIEADRENAGFFSSMMTRAKKFLRSFL